MKSAHNRITIENLNHPGKTQRVDVDKYEAMKQAYLAVVSSDGPGMTLDEIRVALPPLLPGSVFPGGAKANWYAKAVQLDLEAKGLIKRDKSSPLRIARV